MWIARDKSDYLCVYTEKPEKGSIQWQIPSNEGGMIVTIDSALFPEVKWVDEEPTEVDIVPKTNQSKKHEESKSIDWEQRRYETAKEAISAIMSNDDFYKQVLYEGAELNNRSIPHCIVKAAYAFADALIEELIKEE